MIVFYFCCYFIDDLTGVEEKNRHEIQRNASPTYSFMACHTSTISSNSRTSSFYPPPSSLSLEWFAHFYLLSSLLRKPNSLICHFHSSTIFLRASFTYLIAYISLPTWVVVLNRFPLCSPLLSSYLSLNVGLLMVLWKIVYLYDDDIRKDHSNTVKCHVQCS